MPHGFRPVGRAARLVALACFAPSALGAWAEATPQSGGTKGLGGAEAVRAFDSRLPEIAQRHGMTAPQLAMLLATDASVRINDEGRVFYVCPKAPDEPLVEQVGPTVRDIPLSQAFLLHSNPGASKTIYLDFDRHHSVNNSWGHNIVFPPFDRDGNPGSFSDAELAEIIGHWEQVAEDFAPFDVNVTTQDPGVEALRRTGGGDTQYGVRSLHTQPTDGFGNGIGGVAFLNSFDDSIDNPVFSFNKGVLNGGMTGSHEVGHALGLSHDGLNGSAYHPGSGNSSNRTSWGPIMGAPFGKNVVHWSNGDYAGATTTQDDLAIITKTANGINYLPDDHGDTFQTATPVLLDVPVAGLIGRSTDVDAFRLDLPCGLYSLSVNPIHPGPNLDMRLELYDSGGTLLASNDADNQVLASLNWYTPGGTYYLLTEGVGHVFRYSAYGSMGQYTLLAGLVQACEPDCLADIDGNGTLNLDDVDAFVSAFSAGSAAADMDGNGILTLDDVDAFVAAFAAGCP